jgi:hypothetical protein
MRIIVLGLPLLVAACLDDPPLPASPGTPFLWMASAWMKGGQNTVTLGWPNGYRCGVDAWGCREPKTTMTVLAVACNGCTFVDDPTGKTSDELVDLIAVAEADDQISIDVKLRFDATGAIQSLSRSAVVDHEVALETQCRLIRTGALAPGSTVRFIDRSEFRDCEATRRADDTVVLFPAIRTSRGETLFPFCADPCEWPSDEFLRPRSTISMTTAPKGWGLSDAVTTVHFAVMPELGATQSVSLSALLLSGEVSTTSVAIPPLQ